MGSRISGHFARDPHLCAAHERLFLSAVIPSGRFQNPGGCTNEMFNVCLGDHEALLLVTAAEGDFVSAELPVCIFRTFKSARMTALQNGTGGVSSIATGSATMLSRQSITGRGNSLRAFQFPSFPLGQELMVCCVNSFSLGSCLEVGAYDRVYRALISSMLRKDQSLRRSVAIRQKSMRPTIVLQRRRVVCRWRTEIPIDTTIVESCNPQRAAGSECPNYTTVSSCSRVCVTFTCSNSSCAIRSRTGCRQCHGFCCTNATLVIVTIVCVLTIWKSWVLRCGAVKGPKSSARLVEATNLRRT